MPTTKLDVANFGKILSEGIGKVGEALVKTRRDYEKDEILKRYRNPDAVVKRPDGSFAAPEEIASKVGADMMWLVSKGYQGEAQVLQGLYGEYMKGATNVVRNIGTIDFLNTIAPDYLPKDQADRMKKLDLRAVDPNVLANFVSAKQKADLEPEKIYSKNMGGYTRNFYLNRKFGEDVYEEDDAGGKILVAKKGDVYFEDIENTEAPARTVRILSDAEITGSYSNSNAQQYIIQNELGTQRVVTVLPGQSIQLAPGEKIVDKAKPGTKPKIELD